MVCLEPALYFLTMISLASWFISSPVQYCSGINMFRSVYSGSGCGSGCGSGSGSGMACIVTSFEYSEAPT